MDVVRRADWVVDVGPGAGERRRADPAQRPGRGAGGGAGLGHPAVPLPRAGRAGRRGAGRAAAADRPARALGRDPAQRAPPRRRVPARRPHGGDRRLGVGQVDPGEPGAGRRRRGAPRHAPPARGVRRRGGRAGRRRPGRGARRSRQGHRAGGGRPARAGRPEADRAHAPVQPGDLHRPVRRGAQAVRRDGRGPGPRLGRGPVLLQRRRWAVRDLPGRGVRGGGAALPARHLRPVPDLPRRALRPGDPRGHLPRPHHRGRAGHDGRRGERVLRRRPGGRRAACGRCRTSGSATCGWGSRPPSCPAARRSGSSWPPSCSGPGAVTRSTCWTSRPPACTRPTWRC